MVLYKVVFMKECSLQHNGMNELGQARQEYSAIAAAVAVAAAMGCGIIRYRGIQSRFTRTGCDLPSWYPPVHLFMSTIFIVQV